MSDDDEFTWLFDRRVPNQDPAKPASDPAPGVDQTRVIPVTPAAGNTAERPRVSDNEHTRVVPVSRKASAAPRTTVPRTAPPAAAMPQVIAPAPGAAPVRPPRRKRPVRLIVLGLLALIVLWVGSVIYAGFDVWGHVHQVAYAPSGARPAQQPGTTYLMVGSDSRFGLTPAEIRKYAPGSSPTDTSARTDTMMLVHTGSGGTVVMSIPRDSPVEIPGYGTYKINSAFAWGGPKLLVKTIEADTGIRIDGYIETGFAGLAKMVNAVGGITVCPKQDMAPDPTDGPLGGSGFTGMTKGCHKIGGATALAYARDRHTVGLGDLDRAAHQREVISAVMHKLRGFSFLANPFRLDSAGSQVVGTIQVGKGMSMTQAYTLFNALKSLSSGKAKSCGLPVVDLSTRWDPQRSQEMFNFIKNDQANKIPKSLCTPSGLAG